MERFPADSDEGEVAVRVGFVETRIAKRLKRFGVAILPPEDQAEVTASANMALV